MEDWIANLERLHAEAAPPPWTNDMGGSIGGPGLRIYAEGGHTDEDAALIAAMRNALPRLIAAAKFCELVAEIGITGDIDRLSGAFIAYLEAK
jgi:hypothetical protein